jgi:hypothetical protein
MAGLYALSSFSQLFSEDIKPYMIERPYNSYFTGRATEKNP